MTHIKKFNEKYSSVNEEFNKDHEVKMTTLNLDAIIENATELKRKLGSNEKDIPAWIEEHIANAKTYICDANNGYYEYNPEDFVEYGTLGE